MYLKYIQCRLIFMYMNVSNINVGLYSHSSHIFAFNGGWWANGYRHKCSFYPSAYPHRRHESCKAPLKTHEMSCVFNVEELLFFVASAVADLKKTVFHSNFYFDYLGLYMISHRGGNIGALLWRAAAVV